jgi:predicted dehydrogenase
MSPKNFNRRQFLKRATTMAAGTAALPYLVSASALGQSGSVAPSNRITIGNIGAGPQGFGVTSGLLHQEDAQVVAICDVKRQVREERRQLVDEHYGSKGCEVYNDYRDLLARDDIDGVVIGTPDHWHVLVGLEAARTGKDMYLEKPMGMSLAQDQALRDAVHRYGTVFQFGTQQRSEANFRQACELALNERIGKLHTIYVWAPGSETRKHIPFSPVPDGFDYELWLGPAPYRPYDEDLCSSVWEKKYWWFHSDFALGFIAGWGVHPLDIALWGGGKKLTGPVEVSGTGEFPTEGPTDTATKWMVTFKYAGGITMNFTDHRIPDDWRQRFGVNDGHGTLFEGTEGWVHVDRGGINAHPKSLLKSVIGPNEIHLPKSNHHGRNFLDAIKTRGKTVSHIDDAVQADILCHLADIATRLERKLVWDLENERFVNDDQANRMLTRAMRSPWRLS